MLVGTDRFGNKYYENNDEELPCEFLLQGVGGRIQAGMLMLG